MTSNRHQQRGLAMGGWLLLIVVFGMVITMGMKLAPLYLDHNTMSGVLDGMAAEDGLAGKRKADLQGMIEQRFKINNVRGFNVKDNIEIKRTKNGTELVMDYEVRQNLFYNVDLVTYFDKTVELRN
tara:strand:- start:609 stop:986 length:378 start_codon:yes stop_codon:yes gene_type:complete